VNLLTLRYFITIAEYSSFTKASEHLFVTQPTLSRQIIDLEQEFGVQLFMRGKHSLSLTNAGHRFLVEAKEIAKRCDRLAVIMKQEKEEVTGSLKIGYQGFLDNHLMYTSLKSTIKKNPYIEFSLTRCNFADLNDFLMVDKLDLIFTVSSCVDMLPNITSIKFEENKLEIAVPSDHRLANQRSVRASDLVNEKFIMMERNVSPLTVDYSIGFCIKNGFSPIVSYYVKDVDTALFLVGSGKGIAFLFSRTAIHNPQDVKILEIEDFDVDCDIALAYKKDNTNPAIPIFISEIKSIKELIC